jgi:methionine-rich copper-binding protein CopC
MSRALVSPRRKFGNCRPSLERLESRLALSLTSPMGGGSTILGPSVSTLDTTSPAPLGPDLTVLSTTPTSGSALTQSPTTVTVLFDRPIDSSTFGSEDVVIEQFVDGSWQDASDPANLPLETTDDSGTQLILTLPNALALGQYQIVFSGNSFLSGVDGSMLASVGSDQVLGQFTIAAPAPPPVAPPAATLATATDLGSPSTGLITVKGALDLASNPGAVQLYKIELPNGQFWRLGSAIAAERIGSPLNSLLSLFDAQGNLLLTTTTGRVDALNDPFFFTGLRGGTYYIGVSGVGNAPGQPGGYDPVSGQAGTASPTANGGTFLLNVVADPVLAPTQLLGYTIDRADPIGPPTGVSLTFSGPLNMTSIAGKSAQGIVLVNQAGQSFPITAIAANPGQTVYSFVWDQALPTGRYTVKIPSADNGGLTDLAGLTPSAPGQPAGTLLSFVVVAQTLGTSDSSNIGPLYNFQNASVERQGTITPLSAANYRFVVLWDGFFKIQVQSPGVTPAVTLYGPSGIQTLSTGGPGNLLFRSIHLTPGMYILQLTNPSRTTIHVDWVLASTTDFDSLLMNGVGQGPALNLRLMTPTTDGSATDANSGVSGPTASNAGAAGGSVTGSTPGTSSSAGRDFASAAGLAGPVSSFTLYLSAGGTLVGRPDTAPGYTASPSASQGPGMVALSSGGIGTFQRLGFGEASTLSSSSTPVQDPELGDGTGAPEGPAPVDGAIVAAKASKDEKEQEREQDGDRQVVQAAELIASLGNQAGRWLARFAGQDIRVDPAQVAADPIAVASDGAPASRRKDVVRYAEINTPIVIGAATVMAMQYYRPLRRWVAKTRGKSDLQSSLASRNRVRGPHGRI